MECVIHLHISFMTLMTISIMSTCSYLLYISTIIGRRYYFNFTMLNSLSSWIMVTLKPRASYLSSSMSSTAFIWAVDLYFHGWVVTKFNFVYLAARKGYPFTKNKSMYNCTSLWYSGIGNDSGMRSILYEFGWYLVILPCNRGVPGP